MNSWRSFHLFYAQPEHADLLAIATARILRDLTDSHDDWFFIRYAEGGAHLRIRVGQRIDPVYDAFRAQAAAECAALAENVPVSEWVRSIGYPDSQGTLFTPGAIADVEYVPETRRYGGPHALKENERLFRLSTAIAVRAIDLTVADHRKRARLAIDLMLMTAAATDCCNGSPSAFFSTYAIGWSNGPTGGGDDAFVGKALVADGMASRFDAHRAFLASGRPADSLVGHWGVAVGQAYRTFMAMAEDGLLISPIQARSPTDEVERSRAIAGMFYSQIHMMNNRLGFAPQTEILWSESIAAHFGDPAKQSDFPLDELRLALGMRTARPLRDPPS